MPLFDYRAANAQGELKTGQMSAGSEADVVARLQAMGLIPMSAVSHQEGEGRGSLLELRLRPARLGADDIADMTRQLATLVSAGLPLDRCFDVMTRVSGKPLMAGLIGDLQSAVRGGAPLSQALEQRPELFGNFYVNFVRAAELSGRLGPSLQDLSDYLEKARALREQLKSALLYPVILLVVTLASLGVIVVFVLPEFSTLFEDMDAPLPGPTAAVFALADGLRQFGLLLALLAAGALWYWRRRGQDPVVAYERDQRRLNSRLFGDLARKINMARFSRSLGTLLSGGVALLPAIAVAREGMENRVLREKLDTVAATLRDGGGLTRPLLEAGVFPEFALQMIQVGEETGQLDTMLVRVADIYDEEVETATRRLLAVLEPVMIIGLGLVIGGIIVSILVAILGINDLPM